MQSTAVESAPRRSRVREVHVINDWVLMEPDQVRVSEGGILIPDSVEPEYQSVRGLCIGVGDGVLCENGERAPMLAIEGKEYEYLIYTKKVVKVNGKEYDLVRDRDLVCWYE